MSFMEDLCDKLQLSVENEMKGITSQDLMSSKINELMAQRDEQRSKEKATVAQQNYLNLLGVKKSAIPKGLTKAAASDLIRDAKAKNKGPLTHGVSAAQQRLLQELGYIGPAPGTRSKASEIISRLRLSKAAKRFVARAKAMRLSEAEVERLERIVALVPKNMLQG
jgi:hypothetical protein